MRVALFLCAGTIMLLSSLAHAFLGWPSMRDALQAAGNPADLVHGLAAGWFFGTAAMATFGAIVVSTGMRLRRGEPAAIGPVRWIAVWNAAAEFANGEMIGSGPFKMKEFNTG